MTDFLKGNVADNTPIGDNHGGKLVGRNKMVDDNNTEIGSKIGTRTHGAGIARRSYDGASKLSAALTGVSEALLHNCGTGRCYFATGAAPTATINDTPLEPGEKWAVRITPGDKVAVIQDTTGGNLNIIPLA